MKRIADVLPPAAQRIAALAVAALFAFAIVTLDRALHFRKLEAPASAEASRNSSGTYTLYSPGNPVISGTTIASSWANNTLTDIQTEITDSLSRSGKGGMTAALRGADGTVASPAYSFTSEPGTGLYRIGASDVGFAVNSVKQLELTSTLFTVSGALGVGAAATYPLDVGVVTGATTLRLTAAGREAIGFASRASQAGIGFNAHNDDTNWIYEATNPADMIVATTSGDMIFYTAPSGTAGTAATITERARINSSGLAIGASGTAISASFRGSGSWTPGSITSGNCASTSITVTGAAAGTECAAGAPQTVAPINGMFYCYISAINTCTVQWCNYSGIGVTPSAGTYSCRAFNP